MIQPNELKLNLPIDVANGVISNTGKVWEILASSYMGKLEKVKYLVNDCPELVFAKYNYTPAIHLAVREGHLPLVKYLLEQRAHDPAYSSYPFLDDLPTIAKDRNYNEIAMMLTEYANDASRLKYKCENGRIYFNRTALQKEFEKAVDRNDLALTEKILKAHPGYALDETYFWGEGILMMPAKENHRQMITLLMNYGARVPNILKWTQFYYFERYDGAAFMMEKGMSPNVMSWQHVTILHDMAQKGDVLKAELLIGHGADINAIEEEYQSTPLGMAARWGHLEMVEYLLKQKADPNKSGASWSTPLAWAKKKGHLEIEKLLIDSGAR